MIIDCVFEWDDQRCSPTSTYCKFFTKIKELRPDIEFNFVDSVPLRVEATKKKLYFGGNSCWII